MTEQVKFILSKLNAPPFRRNFNLISFDALRSEQLLQLMYDVFAQIDEKMKIDVRLEDPEQVAIQTLGFLRILKFKPPSDMPLSTFRQGLVTGDKAVIVPILSWTLDHLEDHKKRAYLAQYLVKVQLPPDIEGDADIVDLMGQYDELIEEFKEIHKENESLKESGFNTAEIRRDLEHMEEERRQLNNKIERLQRRVVDIPKRDYMLGVARSLREEQDTAETLAQQRIAQQDAKNHSEQKLRRLTLQLKDIRQSSMGATPESLLSKLEEEVRANAYLLREKIPKEIANLQRLVEDLQKIASEPAMTPADLETIKEKIQLVNNEINQLYEQKLRRSDHLADEKLTLFRQQASIVARKKDAAAEQMNALRNKLQQLQHELEEKQKQSANFEDAEHIKGEEFRKYVTKLKAKSNTYKQKKDELEELRAETNRLAAEESQLLAKEKEATENLIATEDASGVSGFHATAEKLEEISALKAKLDEKKGRTLEEMSQLVEQLNAHIGAKKSELAPVIRELKPLRQEYQDLQEVHKTKKQAYDALALSMESKMSKLEEEVSTLSKEVNGDESQEFYCNRMIKIIEAKRKLMIEKETALVQSQDPKERKQSLRDKLNAAIQESEQKGKMLREKQKQVRDHQGSFQDQVKTWTDLSKIFECKIRVFQRERNQTITINGANDRLVL